jgi:hypothetical protein
VTLRPPSSGVLVSDIMTAFPAFIRLGADIRRAAEVVCVSEVGRLMVVDHGGAIPADRGLPGPGGPLGQAGVIVQAVP